jgi:protein ImuA
MGRPAHLLASLRQSLERFEPHRVPARLGHPGADAVLRGLRREALHEVYAAEAGDSAAASGFAAGLAHRLRADRTILWIRQEFSALEHGEINGSGLLELGMDPARLILLRVDHAKDVLKAAGDALTCTGLGAVVLEIYGEHKALDLTATRRLMFATQRDGVSAILLRLGAKADASAAETRWIVRSAPSPANGEDDFGFPRFDATLARNRHGATGRWIMEWNGNDGSFHEPAENPFDVAAPPADGPLAAEEWRREDWRRAG